MSEAGSTTAVMDTTARINQLLELKADPSVKAQMDYVDLVTTEMARYCHTQEQTYAAAELLDHLITELAWARLRLQATLKPATASITYLGTGHKPTNNEGPDAA